MLYKATIEVLVEGDSDAEACDAIAEGLRPMLREYCESEHPTSWIDWRYAPHGDPVLYVGAKALS